MFVLFFLGTNVLLAQKKVSGIVKEADTNEPLLMAAEDRTDAPSSLLWVRREELADTYSIPAAFGYFTPQ